MILDTTEGFREGESLRDDGMERAARFKLWQIRRGQLALLEAILRDPDGESTTDAATNCLGHRYADGGKWRGTIPRQLANDGLIEKVGVTRSVRPCRHAGYLTLWRGVDDTAISDRIGELRQWLAVNTPNVNIDNCIPLTNKPDPSAATDEPGNTKDLNNERTEATDGYSLR